MSENKKHSCPEEGCGRVLENLEQLRLHMKKRHNRELPIQTESSGRSLAKEVTEIHKLKESVSTLTSELKNEMLTDDQIYARSLLEVEMYQKKAGRQDQVTFEEIQEAKRQLTDQFILEKAAEAEENEGVQNLELVEVLRLSFLKLVFFDRSDCFQLDRLIMLRDLDLSNNRLTSLAGMKHLIHLEVLCVSGNLLDRLMGLEDCSNLEKLECSGNMIETVFELKHLIKLRSLDLSHNKLRSFESLMVVVHDLPKLKELNLKGHTFTRLANYKHDILLKKRLERLDGNKIYDGDFEIARAFHKHFLSTNCRSNMSKSLMVGSCSQLRPSTAPGFRPTALPEKKFVGKITKLQDDEEDEDNFKEEDEDEEEAEELREHITNLKQENEEIKDELDQMTDKCRDLEADLKTFELQNKALQVENRQLQMFIEINKSNAGRFEKVDGDEKGEDYYKKQYLMQSEICMRYLDEIQRLKRIIDENGFATNSEEEDETETNQLPKKPRIRRKQSNMSDEIEEYQPFRLKSGESKNKANRELVDKIQSSLNKRVIHVKIKTEEGLTDSDPKPQVPVQDEGKKEPPAKSSIKEGLRPMRKVESKRTVELDAAERVSNASKLSKDSFNLGSNNNSRIAPGGLVRRVQPTLKPMPVRGRLIVDPNLSKHSLSENNSAVSDPDDINPEEFESLLMTTSNLMAEFRKELRELNEAAPPQAPSSAKSRNNMPPKLQSSDKRRPAEPAQQPVLDGLISTAAYNPPSKQPSKASFSIRHVRQRSLSKSKK